MNATFLVLAPRLRRACLLFTLGSVPLLVLQGVTHDPFNVPKLALLLAGTAVAGALLIAERIAGAPREGRWPLAVPIAAILVPLSISWIFSPYRAWALLGEYGRFQGLLPYAAVALLGVLLAQAFRGRPLPIAWVLSASGALVGGYSLVQMLGLDPVPQVADGIDLATNVSTIGHTNFTGGFMAITLPLSIYLWARVDRGRLIAAGLTALTGVGILLSFSQGAWFATVAGVAVVAGMLLGRTRPLMRIAGLCVATLVALTVVGSVALSLAFPDSPTLGGTIRTRGYLWASAVGQAADSPLVGRGPNSYAIEGVRHRSLESALSEEYGVADDPHSVPLAFLANAGLLGLIGWLAMIVWGLRVGSEPGDPIRGAFLAALIAYAVQALASIDVLSLRVALWGCLAGIVAAGGAPLSPGSSRGRPGRGRVVLASSMVLVVTVAGGSLAYEWIATDIRVERALEAFQRGDIEAGRRGFEGALEFRDEPEYRKLYTARLALAALDLGPSGHPLIARMREVDGHLERVPQIDALRSSATLLHYWGQYEPAADDEALALFQRASVYDPFNPLIKAQLSEVLIDLGRADEAVSILEEVSDRYEGTAPEYWGALAIARVGVGDQTGASSAHATGLSIDGNDCRVISAGELLSIYENPERAPSAMDVGRLRIACSEGLYAFFLDQVPSDLRPRYE